MIVHVSATDPPRVDDHDDLQHLHVIAPAGTDLARIAPLGHPADDEHVWLDIEMLRAAAAPSADAAIWHRNFEEMVTYAVSRGWTEPVRTPAAPTPTPTHLRAHLQWSPPN